MIKMDKNGQGCGNGQKAARDTASLLLEEMKERLGCVYLSDLRYGYWQSVLRLVLVDIPPERYGLGSWNQAAGYIMGRSCSFSTCKGAWDALMDYSLSCLEHGMYWEK